jgi:hypothetical protein
MIDKGMLVCVLGCVFVLSACSPAAPAIALTEPVAATRDGERAIAHELDDFHDAAAKADEARYFSHLHPSAIFLGTDATERWTVEQFRAYAHPHFAKGKAWAFHSKRRAIQLHASGKLAWFDEDLETQNLGPARGSGVLVLEGGRWSITQYNLTLTIPNERFPRVKAALADVDAPFAKDDPLKELAWLGGAWVAQRPDGEVTEELWLAPSGGSMLGVGRSVRAGKTAFFEHLRIEARGTSVVYVASPRGGNTTEFVATKSDATTAVFENRKHDWPKRISYSAAKDGVHVRVEGDPGQPVEEWIQIRSQIVRP